MLPVKIVDKGVRVNRRLRESYNTKAHPVAELHNPVVGRLEGTEGNLHMLHQTKGVTTGYD
jgi:hypothetical protein